ncbi:MAG: HAD-IIIA family hydrolase [Bdellovibrionia bacterium]
MILSRGLIILDRDGVLNSVVVDAEHGTIDSPLHPSQVQIYPWVPGAIALLNSRHYGVAIATNQPAAAKSKTTKRNLELVHDTVVKLAEGGGGKILTSHICFHRSEDGCECRKPKPGLLLDAISKNSGFDLKSSWMVGDGVTDIQAGHLAGLKTAFVGSKKWDAQRVFEDAGFKPTVWVENLLEFAEYLI